MPESDTKFFVAGAEVTFPTVAAGGHVDQVTLTLASREIVYKRLDDVAAKPVLAAVAALDKRMRDNTPLPGSEDALRQVIAGLQAAKPVDNLLGPNAQPFMASFQRQVVQMGAVKSIRFQAVGPAGPDIYQVQSEKGTWICRIWLAANGKVDRVIAQPAN